MQLSYVCTLGTLLLLLVIGLLSKVHPLEDAAQWDLVVSHLDDFATICFA